MLLLRPSRRAFCAVARAVANGDASEVCPVGHDQPVLNAVFSGRWKALAPWTAAKATMRCAHIPEAPDAFHFFSSTAPWSHQCARCVAAPGGERTFFLCRAERARPGTSCRTPGDRSLCPRRGISTWEPRRCRDPSPRNLHVPRAILARECQPRPTQVAAGSHCSRRERKDRKNVEACMAPRLYDAQRLWWRELMELPADSRARVDEFLEFDRGVAYC